MTYLWPKRSNSLHVGTAFAGFGDQEQTANVGGKGDRCDGHHLQQLRITARQKAPANFDQTPSGKDKRIPKRCLSEAARRCY